MPAEESGKPRSRSSSTPVSTVSRAVGDARREAEATRREIEAISAGHLKALLSDPKASLSEHVDDAELTAPDRSRLLQTLRSRQQASRPLRLRPTAGQHWHPSRKAIVWSVGTPVVLGLLLALPLRNTTERAIVVTPFSTAIHMPDGEIRRLTLPTTTTMLVRRWLRRQPVAVVWIDDAKAYAQGPVIRSAITFPGFPYLD